MNSTLVLTVIGDDRAGLVKALADVIDAGGGNWEESRLSELAGKFAGIVVVTVPTEKAAALNAALAPLDGLLEVVVHEGASAEAPASSEVGHQEVRIELLGNDHPGIVSAVSGVLSRHGVSVAEFESTTRDAPMAGGRLFDATAVITIPGDADPAALQAALQDLATELMVDLTVSSTH